MFSKHLGRLGLLGLLLGSVASVPLTAGMAHAEAGYFPMPEAAVPWLPQDANADTNGDARADAGDAGNSDARDGSPADTAGPGRADTGVDAAGGATPDAAVRNDAAVPPPPAISDDGCSCDVGARSRSAGLESLLGAAIVGLALTRTRRKR